MRNIVLIAKREFLTQVKKKAFVILTILMPLLVIGFGWVVSLIFQANKNESTIMVSDKSGIFKNQLKSNENVTYVFSDLETGESSKELLKDKEYLDGILLIPKIQDIRNLEDSIELLTNKNIGYEVRGEVTRAVTEILKEQKIKKMGLLPAQIQDLDREIRLKVTNISAEEVEDNNLLAVKSGVSVFLMYVIFIFILMYGVRIMRSVLEEKNNRVVEILISSVKPFELMIGKIMGVTGVALLQFLVWVMMIIASFHILGSPNAGIMASASDEIKNIYVVLNDLDYGMIFFVFVIYFLLGYLFYSSMYAAIGSAVDNETETQQFSLFAILPLMLGFYGSISIMNNPDGEMSFWLSMIPFTSPIAMLARIPFDVPLWELILSIMILLISVISMMFIASKIYRIGILMYGNKVTFKDLWKWLRQ